MNPRTSRLIPPSLLFCFSVLFFCYLIPGNRFFCFRDLLLFHYPLRQYWISALMSGQPPFLNLALNAGQPILANPNYAVFYPGNILYMILPFQLAWNLSLAGHVFWGGLGVYWLARVINCQRFAALSAALAFAFGGPFLSSMTYYNLLI